MRWHRLDLIRGVVTVADVILQTGEERTYPKGKKSLPVPLTPRTLSALRAHLERYPRPMDRVFVEPGRGLARVTPQRMANLWRQVLATAQIAEPLPVFHDLRHGCGHALHAAGAPIDVIQAVLRHQQISTSKIYMPDVAEDEARYWLDRTQRDAPRDLPRPA